jgi:predicted HicB family RNase H-like nuclease
MRCLSVRIKDALQLTNQMAINKETTIQVRVSMPREVHAQLKEIAKKRGISLSALLLTTAID